MPTVQTRFDPCDCDDKNICIDKGIVQLPGLGDKIKFRNKLTEDASIEFFFINEKGVAGKEIAGFCTEVSSAQFPVGVNKNKTCTPSKEGNFAYTISATDYNTLDPVLIVVPHRQQDVFFGLQGAGLIALGVSALIALVVGIAVGKRMNKNNNASERGA